MEGGCGSKNELAQDDPVVGKEAALGLRSVEPQSFHYIPWGLLPAAFSSLLAQQKEIRRLDLNTESS